MLTVLPWLLPATAAELRDGDLVFQTSRSAQSDAIASATGSRWTHTGIVRLVDGEPWVLEASATVRRTPLSVWIAAGDGPIAVRRWAEPIWTEPALARLDALERAWLGRPYDARFEPGDDRLYCSELVREAGLRAAGVELAPLRPLGSYAIEDPALRARIIARWGTIPSDLAVVAPSDLADAAGMVAVPWP